MSILGVVTKVTNNMLEWIRNGGDFKEFVMYVTDKAYKDEVSRKLVVDIAVRNFKEALIKVNLQMDGEPVIEWIYEPETFENMWEERMLYCKLTAKVMPLD